MKLRKQAFVSAVCSLALVGNSFGVLAQDKAATQEQSGKVVVRTPDGQTKEFTLEGNGTVFVDQDGQKIRVNRAGKEDSAQAGFATGFVSGTGGAAATFFSQDGVTRTLNGQDFVFVNGQAGGAQGGTFSFVTSEMGFENKLVKGAPFSAETENESIKTLADGNRIVHKNSGLVARDSEGRLRRENTINAVGQFSSTEPLKTVTINDPVAGTMYILEPHNRVARKMGGVRTLAPQVRSEMTPPQVSKNADVSKGVLQGFAVKKVPPSYPPVAKAARAAGVVQVQITVSEDGKVTEATAVSGHPLLRDAAVEAARQWEFKPTEASGSPVKAQSTLSFNFTLADDENKAAGQAGNQETLTTTSFARTRLPKYETKEESLGKQVIEGVEAEGKRKTTIIPEGAIGNERAIEIVSESWYSPELQTTVLSKRQDPTSGETIFRLTNIRRGNPDASLFQVPSDYTVKEGGVGGGFGFSTGAGVGVGGTVRVQSTKPDNQ